MKKVFRSWLMMILFFFSFLSFPEVGRAEWHQEAHDAQHTGYTDEDASRPWSFKWQWNGSCSDGGDCRPGDPEKGWSFLIPPRSHPVGGGGRLYLPAGDEGVWAISESNGQTAWHNSNVRSFCTAAYDPETQAVFVAAADSRLYKLSAASGNSLGSFQADSGLNQAPIIVGSRVYAASDKGTLYAIDKNSLSQVWSYSAGSPIQTPPAYSSASGGVLILATADLYVHGVNTSNGSGRWRKKPTVNVNGSYTYDGGDGKRYPAYHWEHSWPVVAEEHGIVFVRLHLPKKYMWSVPTGWSWYPDSNQAIRQFLSDRPELQTLFALKIDNGETAFIPAVGTGGIETPHDPVNGGEEDETEGPMPVIKRFPGGEEVAYIPWRNGQKCAQVECYDARWDSVMGEMVLEETVIGGNSYQAGDLRFVQGGFVTDSLGDFSMAGDVYFHVGWPAMGGSKVTNRSSGLGHSYTNPISVESQGRVLNRIDGGRSECSKNTATHYCSGGMQIFCDGGYMSGGGWWVFWDTEDPPWVCGPAYSDGYKARYAIVNNGTIYYELNGGTIFALQASGGPLVPTPTPTPRPSCAGGGDIDCDNDVDKDDLLAVLAAWLTKGTAVNNFREDANGDGKVNGLDFGYVISHQ